jgi:dipeptidyl-peptidase 4
MRYFLIFITIVCLFESDSFSQNNKLKSRAEVSNYEETSLFSDIMSFLTFCKSKSGDLQLEYFMKSAESKDIPLAVISDKNILDKNKIKIFIIAGIHSGEVDGKEASFILIRELLFGKLHYLLKKCTVFIIPTLNVDGNDKVDRYNRLSQNGPLKGVGLADFPNGMNN